jgi:hypothetical protein
MSACGVGGAECAICDAAVGADACLDGFCKCGGSNACGAGDRECVGHQCVCKASAPGCCDANSCAGGCCDDENVCHPEVVGTTCGTGGGSCQVCLAHSANQCSGGTCECGSGPACLPGQWCIDDGGGAYACVCNADSCATGCCTAFLGGACHIGTEDEFCGENAGSCTNCGPGNMCDSDTRTCTCQTSGEDVCTGCCDTAGSGLCEHCESGTSDQCIASGCSCGGGGPCGGGACCFGGSCRQENSPQPGTTAVTFVLEDSKFVTACPGASGEPSVIGWYPSSTVSWPAASTAFVRSTPCGLWYATVTGLSTGTAYEYLFLCPNGADTFIDYKNGTEGANCSSGKCPVTTTVTTGVCTPTIDGTLGSDWDAHSIVRVNGQATDWSGNELRSLRVCYDDDNLYLGIGGEVDTVASPPNLVAVYLDAHYGDGSGVFIPSGTLTDTSGNLDHGLSANFTSWMAGASFGGEFAWGTTVMSVSKDSSEESDNFGLRDITSPSDFGWVKFDTVSCSAHTCEVQLPWTTLFKGPRPTDAHVALFVRLVSWNGQFFANQTLPQDYSSSGPAVVTAHGVLVLDVP